MEKRVRIKEIDGLRGVACIGIVLFHANYRVMPIELASFFERFGATIVELFIAISAFSLSYSYKKRICSLSFIDFFKKRYFTIMPLYWITDCVTYVLHILTKLVLGDFLWGYKTLFDLKEGALDLLLEFSGFYTGWFGKQYVPMNEPLWTVCCLLLCYVIFYYICYFSRNDENLYLFVVLITFTVMMYLLKILPDSHQEVRCIAAFSFGLLFYEFWEKASIEYGRIALYVYLLLLIFVVVMCFTKGFSFVEFMHPNSQYFAILFLSPLCLFEALYGRIVGKLLKTKAIVFLGSISMSIYMWHINVEYFFHPSIWGRSYVNLFLCVGLSIFVGFCSNKWLEPRLRKIIAKIC